MFRVKMKCAALAVMALGAGAAYAADGDSMFKVSGFGTIAATHSSEKNADFVASMAQPSGSGSSRDWDWANDSRFGLQVDTKLTDTLSATVQLLAEQESSNRFGAHVHVANIKWQATDKLSFRVGRMLQPFYLISDYQKVGYSLPWVRGPLEVYQIGIFSNYDGADVTYKTSVGGVAVTTQAFAGNEEVNLPHSSKVHAKKEVGFNVTAETGFHLFRVSYQQANGTLDNPLLDNVIYPAAGPALTAHYDLGNQKKKFMALGYTYDPGNWFLMTELASLKGSDDMFGKHTGAYVTAGYRMGAFTPFGTLSRMRVDNSLDAGNPFINMGLNSLTNVGRRVASVGVRWDFMKNVDLKLQLDHVTLEGAGSHGMLQNAFDATGALRGISDSYNVFTAAVDYVF